MIKEIAIKDDHDMPGSGDQRVPTIAHNPDRNEFLVVWKVGVKDSQPDAGTLVGRIINADGTLAGSDFVVVDKPRVQHWPTLTYVEDRGKYFMTWTDSRNDGLPPETSWGASGDMDIYGLWLDESGNPVGDEIIIADSENWQTGAEVAYNPVMKRFLITWYDKNPVGDYEIPPDMPILFGPSPSDVKGTIYGAPSFLSGQVTDRAGNSVEDARVLVIGPSLPVLEKTNEYGWFNIVEDTHPAGTYLVVTFKLGCLPAMQIVNYTGDPLQETIEMTKLW
jgi:hypothetical protein